MNTKVHLYSNLQRYTDNKPIIEVEGNTVGECLNNLVNQYPDLRSNILEKNQSIYPGLYISINLKSAKSEQMDRSLNPGDEIYLILIVSGG